MDAVEFHIQLHGEHPATGEDISPGTLSVSDLLKLLAPLEAAITATSKDDLQGRPALALVGTARTASADLGLRSYAGAAVAEVTAAIAEKDWRRLPHEAQTKLHAFSKAIGGRGWRCMFQPNGTPGIREAEISPQHPVPQPATARVEELTTTYGVLTAVGGADPTKWGHLQPIDGAELVHLKFDEQMAKQLADRLFEEVGLEGIATWDTASWSIVSFQVERLLPYRATDARTAFDELREAVGDAFDDVDPLEYQHRIRHGDDG